MFKIEGNKAMWQGVDPQNVKGVGYFPPNVWVKDLNEEQLNNLWKTGAVEGQAAAMDAGAAEGDGE